MIQSFMLERLPDTLLAALADELKNWPGIFSPKPSSRLGFIFGDMEIQLIIKLFLLILLT